MCRYGMVVYKPHYACFDCRKTFKRRLASDLEGFDHSQPQEAKCPECGQLMADMGLDFEAPKKDDVKAWQHLRRLYSVGIAFHSCGCYGPGYIPNDKEALIAYFEEIRKGYEKELEFWRSRTEPTTQQEIDREKSKYWSTIYSVPKDKHPKKGTISNTDAIKYWLDRIAEVNNKLALAKG